MSINLAAGKNLIRQMYDVIARPPRLPRPWCDNTGASIRTRPPSFGSKISRQSISTALHATHHRVGAPTEGIAQVFSSLIDLLEGRIQLIRQSQERSGRSDLCICMLRQPQ